MVEVYNENEQAEQIKAWIREYAPTIFFSIMLVVLAFFGWRFWQNHQLKKSIQASVYYEEMLTGSMSADKKETIQLANDIITDYPNTPYSNTAQLLLAKMAVENGNFQQALTHLNSVMQNGKSNAIKQIARIRSARIYIADKKPQQALELLQKIDDKSYQPLIESIRGDAYAALGNNNKAREAYQAALKSLPQTAANWPLLQMKLNELATT